MEDAAKKIVEKHTPQAYAIALRITGNRSEAWDLVQNAMLRVLKSYGTYDPAYPLEQWLYRILRNLYIDRLRAEGRRREEPLDEPPGEGRRSRAETLADPSPGPEQTLESKNRGDVVQEALNALPVDLRMAVVLVDLEGYTYEQAAQILEIPAATLGVRVFRGRKALRKKLAPFLEA